VRKVFSVMVLGVNYRDKGKISGQATEKRFGIFPYENLEKRKEGGWRPKGKRHSAKTKGELNRILGGDKERQENNIEKKTGLVLPEIGKVVRGTRRKQKEGRECELFRLLRVQLCLTPRKKRKKIPFSGTIRPMLRDP